MSQFDTSIAKMKSSFDAIAAAKTHTVVLDFVPNRKTTGKAGATTKTVTTKVVKPVEKLVVKLVVKPVEAEYTKQPEGIQGVVAEEVVKKTAKKPVVKSSKLKKLLRGKTIDCTA